MQEPQAISEKVIEKITNEKMKIIPKWHFALTAVFFVFLGVLLFASLLFLLSFLIFSLRGQGFFILFPFGFWGIRSLFSEIFWILILIFGSLIVTVNLLLKRYKFAFSLPQLYNILIVLAVVVLGSFILDIFEIHKNLYKKNAETSPHFKQMYNIARPKEKIDIISGSVKIRREKDFVIILKNGREVFLEINPYTKVLQNFSEGDEVMVFGQKFNENFLVKGVRKTPPKR